MGDCSTDRDLLLVKTCLSGSEHGWAQFWARFHNLVRKVVMDQQKAWKASYPDVEDVVQEVFVQLVSALERYDGEYSVHKFVAGVAKRTARDKFRQSRAGKRLGETAPIDHHDGEAGFIQVAEPHKNPLKELLQAESKEILRQGFAELSPKCLKLLTLRYYEERSFGEIAQMLDMKENTATVDARRCMEKLKEKCHEIIRKGCRK
jgi:RNA polymerase sigma factor (sigma-70 family)